MHRKRQLLIPPSSYPVPPLRNPLECWAAMHAPDLDGVWRMNQADVWMAVSGLEILGFGFFATTSMFACSHKCLRNDGCGGR
jgi:hypothetical protein